MTTPRFYSTKLAAALLGISTSNLNRRIESGEIKVVKAGGTRKLIHIDEIKRIEESWLNGTSETPRENAPLSPEAQETAAESASVRMMKASRSA